MGLLPIKGDRERLAGLRLPRRLVRKKDARGDDFIILGSIDGTLARELQYFVVSKRQGQPGPQEVYEKAWKAFEDMARAAGREAAVRAGVQPDRHFAEFRRFHKPLLPLERDGQTAIFAATSAFDPQAHCLEGSEICPDYKVLES